MRLIADGVVDRDGVPGLAARLGYTERHLHRLLRTELGAGPLALARAQRAQTARTLIESTNLGLAEVAFAAGFGSVRQFNDTLRAVYAVPPSELRATRRGPTTPAGPGTITVRLAYRPPLHVGALLDFLAPRTLPGVDEVRAGTYHRGLRLPHGTGTAALTPTERHVVATLRLTDLRDLAPAVARCRRLLDLDADPTAVDAALATDPALAPMVTAEPGVRVPRAVDGFEVAVRAVVGQQVSVASARTTLTRLLRQLATPVSEARGGELSGFPAAAEVLAAPDSVFRMPAARRETLRRLAAAVAAGEIDLEPGGDRQETRRRLLTLPGIGAWTADYVALRALGDPDVLLPTDVAVRRGAAALGLPTSPDTLYSYADRWRPWRSYALSRLWRAA